MGQLHSVLEYAIMCKVNSNWQYMSNVKKNQQDKGKPQKFNKTIKHV